MVGDELEQQKIEGEHQREPLVDVPKQLESAHDRGLVLSGS